MIRLITTLSILSVLAAVPAWGTTPIFTCGELVASGDTGILQNDLSCGGTVGVSLGPRATLELNGHSISGAGAGVLCAARRCTVEGPGAIAESTGCAVTVQPAVGRVADHKVAYLIGARIFHQLFGHLATEPDDRRPEVVKAILA